MTVGELSGVRVAELYSKLFAKFSDEDRDVIVDQLVVRDIVPAYRKSPLAIRANASMRMSFRGCN